MGKMNDSEKISFILASQDQGKTRHEIKDSLGYKRLDSLTKYMRSRGFEVVDDKYMTSVINSSDDKYMIDVINDNSLEVGDLNKELKNNIVDIANNHKVIKDMIDWFISMDDKYMTDVIEINNGIKIDLPESSIKRTTVRINEEVWNKFQLLADKNKQYDKHDLLSQCIWEFVNKYS